MNFVFQIVLDDIIEQTIHFEGTPKFLNIFKAKLMGRQLEYNGGSTNICFPGKCSTLRAKEWLAGFHLGRQWAAIQVIYHTGFLSSSSVLLESSTHKHRYQRTDSNTSRLPQVEDIMGYFLWPPTPPRPGRHSCDTKLDATVVS